MLETIDNEIKYNSKQTATIGQMRVNRCGILSSIATAVTHAMSGYIFPCNFVTSFVRQFFVPATPRNHFFTTFTLLLRFGTLRKCSIFAIHLISGIDYRGFVVYRATLIVCLVQSWTTESSNKNEREAQREAETTSSHVTSLLLLEDGGTWNECRGQLFLGCSRSKQYYLFPC